MPDNTEHRNDGKKPGKKKAGKRILFILMKHAFLAGCAFFLALLMFVLTMDKVVMPFYQRSGKEIEAPDLTGITIEEARKTVKSMRLVILADSSEYHNTYPKDTISFQIPSPGTIIKPGRRIRANISKGPLPFTVPDVVGKSRRDALKAIQDARLFVDEEGWKPSNDFPYGIVAGQEPGGGQEVPENTGVILFISDGRKETNIIMPDLINLSLSAAKDTLRAYNFNLARVRVQREEQPDLLPNTVIEQYPDPGFPANTSDEVILDVSEP